MEPCFILREYREADLEAVKYLVKSIQGGEFGIYVDPEQAPDLYQLKRVFGKGRGNFWVVEFYGKIVGCIGLEDVGSGIAQIRKMFVHADFRGSRFSLGARLLQKALSWARSNNFSEVYLGTVTCLKRARRFYAKSGFSEISREDWPSHLAVPPPDDRFYRMSL